MYEGKTKPSKVRKKWLVPKAAHTDTYRALQAWNFFWHSVSYWKLGTTRETRMYEGKTKPSKVRKKWLMPKTTHTDTYRALQAWNFFLA